MNQQDLSAFLWSVADLLRGDYKQSDYGKVILPFTVLRRIDCVLAPTKSAVLAELALRQSQDMPADPFLRKKSGQSFYNASPFDLAKLMGDQDNIALNLRAYIQGFSPEVRDIFDRFEIDTQIDRLAKAGLLYLVTEKFAKAPLHPDRVTNHQMGLVFEELIRRFAELSNETAGEHFTPREVIRLMVNLIFIEDDAALSKPGVVRTIYDPTAGTGGMLSVAEEYLTGMNPTSSVSLLGQELNPESYAICKADMLIKGQDVGNIHFGNTLSDDGHPDQKFDYMLSNPPFGMGDADIATITRLFGDFTEAKLARLLDATGKEIETRVLTPGAPDPTPPEGGKVKRAPLSRILPNESFGYRSITLERPLRDDKGRVVLGQKGKAKGKPQPDSALRDTENVPLTEDVTAYVAREVLPHAPDAWIDPEKTKVGYEIPFNRHFYVFEPPRPLAEIDADLAEVTTRIQAMLMGLSA